LLNGAEMVLNAENSLINAPNPKLYVAKGQIKGDFPILHAKKNALHAK